MKSLEFVDHTENVRVSPPRLAKIEHASTQDQVCTAQRQVILQGWPNNIPCLLSVFPISWRTHCSRTIGISWVSLIRSQCAQERNYVPCTLVTSVWEVVFAAFASACFGLGWTPTWKNLSISVTSASLSTIHRHKNLCANTKSLHSPGPKWPRISAIFRAKFYL